MNKLDCHQQFREYPRDWLLGVQNRNPATGLLLRAVLREAVVVSYTWFIS